MPERTGFVPPPYPYDRLDALKRLADVVPGGVVDCSIGNPIDPIPEATLAALTAAAPSATIYPPSIGTAELRAAAAAWIKRRLGVPMDAANVIACVGTKELVGSLPQYLHLRDPGRDTVLYPSVSYPTYAMGATLGGLRAVPVPLDADWQLDLSRVSDADAEHALVLWTNDPGNPTSAVAGPERVAQGVAWARERGIVLAADECYAEFAGGPFHSALREGAQGVLAVHSLSKRSNLAGFRVGFVAGDPDLVGYLGETRRHAGLMVPTPIQAAATAALADDEHVEAQQARYDGPAHAHARRTDRLRARARRRPRTLLPLVAGRGCSRRWLGDRGAPRRGRHARGARKSLRTRGRRSRAPRADPADRAARARAQPPRGVDRFRLTLRSLGRMSDLEATINELWAHRDDLSAVMPEAEAASHVRDAIDLLDRGDARVAELVDGEVVVHQWLKQAILLLFRLTQMSTTELGPFEYRDKIPLKRHYELSGVRVVPGAQARWGAYLAPGVIMMPSYVNIGARVGEDTMVDTWATVGSCAQIGARVHLSGGVGIGGVLEPPEAAPVFIGDDTMIGSRCIVANGSRVGNGVVLGAGCVLTGTIPVIDAETGEELGRGVVPDWCVAVPATRPRSFPGGDFGLACVLVVKHLAEGERHDKSKLNEILREGGVAT